MNSRELSGLYGTERFGGIVTTAELTSAGLTDAKIRVLLHQGALRRVCRGAYADATRVAGLTRDDPGRVRLLGLAAAVAVAGPNAVASHEDAALVHGLTLLDRPPSGTYSVTLPASTALGRARRPGIRLRTSALPVRHVTVCQGIPVTTVARTVIDVARTTAFKAGVVTADSALRMRQTSVAQLSALIWDCDRWPGIVRAREVVAFSDPRAESAFESIARVAFRDGGLPPPILQVWVGENEHMIGRVDFLWSDQWTIAEADGAAKYADPDLARKQLWRDTELRRAGYEVVHFTWRDLASDPAQVVQSIRAAFVRAARLRGRG
jgi:putative AbiEi antitoxin of type IV toxin-antitoxin system/uncharacterized protein DUF559